MGRDRRGQMGRLAAHCRAGVGRLGLTARLGRARSRGRVYRRGPIGNGWFKPGTRGAERNLRPAGWLAAFPYAGQHRSGANQDDRTGDRPRQDTVHVSSKSGSTLEPNIFMDYFFDRVGAVTGKDKAGRTLHRGDRSRFPVGNGEPTSSTLLVSSMARRRSAGAYSVLSKFGLVPAAATGLDVRRLLETTRTMQRSCGADVPPSENPGVQLGIAMGVAATRFGRDKVTIIASPGIR